MTVLALKSTLKYMCVSYCIIALLFSGGRHSAPRSPNCSENWSQRKACENVQDDLWCRFLFWFPYKLWWWADYRLCTYLRQSGLREEIWAKVPTSPGMRWCCIDVRLLCTVVLTCVQCFLLKGFCASTIVRTVQEAFRLCIRVSVHAWSYAESLLPRCLYKPLGNFTIFRVLVRR